MMNFPPYYKKRGAFICLLLGDKAIYHEGEGIMKAKKALAVLFTLSISVSSLPITASAQEITQQQKEDIQTEQSEQFTIDTEAEKQTPENIGAEQQTPENTGAEQQTPEPENTTNEQQTKVKTITIQFDSNGAEETPPENITIATGEEFEPEYHTMTKENHFFAGWSLQQNSADILFTVNEKIIVQKFPDDVTENVTLYAVWQEVKPCQILYDLGNGELIREHTQTGTLPQNIPYENQNGNQIIQWKNAQDDVVDVSSQIITDNTIYYAVYEQQISLLETVKHIKYMDGDNGNS